MNKILYWSPFTSKVATVKSVINSVEAVNKYLNDKYKAIILDAVHEWQDYSLELNRRNIEVIHLNKNSMFNSFKKDGFIRSRFAYLYIFFKSLLPLHHQLITQKPKYLIIHLITSLPLLLFIFKSYETKLILRVSGLPKMTFIRKIIWKLSSKKIYKITCPTQDTLRDLSRFSFLKDKLIVLKDPIIKCTEIQKSKSKKVSLSVNSEKIVLEKDFFLSIGRFTKQKNFIFYLKCIPEILRLNKNLYFLFIGHGEDEEIFNKLAKKLNISERIIVINNTDNVHYFMKKSKCLVLTSLWEDPGFVLVEAGYNNCQVITSDCPNGPKEIVNEDGGYLFQSNNPSSFLKSINDFLKDNEANRISKKIKLKKRLKGYTFYHHSLVLKKILI
ncbi:glycosyltransferase [Pelagibacterales bacterium SAG-MED43]|nr:glycosyltransferase [Pelagibacterales bacterium SAG-MED43]